MSTPPAIPPSRDELLNSLTHAVGAALALAQTGGITAIDALIALAESSRSVATVAARALEAVDPTGTVVATRDASGHWIGRLSNSALSTATAVSALSVVVEHSRRDHAETSRLGRLIAGGLD